MGFQLTVDKRLVPDILGGMRFISIPLGSPYYAQVKGEETKVVPPTKPKCRANGRTQKLKKLPASAVCVGKGILTWLKSERVSDRYGSVYLIEDGQTSLTGDDDGKLPTLWSPPAGEMGVLIAEVLDARESTHIGDLFRGLSPRTPKTGDIIVLGTGRAFTEVQADRKCIGVNPVKDDGSSWMNPRALYDCHESLVRLVWCKL